MSRLVLAAAGKEYEDFRYPKDTFDSTYRAECPFGQAPVLEIDGVKFAQSMAMATFLAREFGMYGKTNLDGFYIDMYVQLIQDLLNKAIKAMFTKDDDEKKKLWAEFKETTSPKYMKWFDDAISKNGTGYLVGDKLSLADIAVYDLSNGFLDDKICSTENFPNVKKMCGLVEANPGIKKWLSVRP